MEKAIKYRGFIDMSTLQIRFALKFTCIYMYILQKDLSYRRWNFRSIDYSFLCFGKRKAREIEFTGGIGIHQDKNI